MFKRKRKLNSVELHQYVDDLQRLTMLRDKAGKVDEQARYSDIIKIMQLVVAEMGRV